jgi:hypothetical protein
MWAVLDRDWLKVIESIAREFVTGDIAGTAQGQSNPAGQ